jgi:hypothetical protein
VLLDIDSAFAHKIVDGKPRGSSVGIIELAMVVGASEFLHTILAPPPPAAAFVNFTVRIPQQTVLLAAAAADIKRSPFFLILVRANCHHQLEARVACSES